MNQILQAVLARQKDLDEALEQMKESRKTVRYYHPTNICDSYTVLAVSISGVFNSDAGNNSMDCFTEKEVHS